MTGLEEPSFTKSFEFVSHYLLHPQSFPLDPEGPRSPDPSSKRTEQVKALFKSARLLFRDFHLSDIEAVHRYSSDPVVTEMTYWGPYDRSGTEMFLQNARERSKANPRTLFDLAIVLEDKEPQKLIGGCKIHVTDLENREGEIGYYLERESWNKGFATETALALLDYGFDRLGLHRIVALCFYENTASARVLEKIGMKREGILRQHRVKKGRWIDSCLYSILDRERDLQKSGLNPLD